MRYDPFILYVPFVVAFMIAYGVLLFAIPTVLLFIIEMTVGLHPIVGIPLYIVSFFALWSVARPHYEHALFLIEEWSDKQIAKQDALAFHRRCAAKSKKKPPQPQRAKGGA